MNEFGSHVLSCSDLFSGAVTIVIPWTDDQIVRCGLRSLGRGRLEQMVAIGAVWVRDACVFRKLHFGAVKSLHIFHALSAFPVVVHRVLFFVLSCRVNLLTRKGAFKIGTRGILKWCRRRLMPAFVTL